MSHLLWVKKKFKLLCSQGFIRRQRNPNSLQDCLQSSERRISFKKPMLVICLLIPSIYYMFHCMSESDEDVGPFSEPIYHKEPLIIDLENEEEDADVIIKSNGNYSDDPDKLFKVETRIHNAEPYLKSGGRLPKCIETIIAGNVTVVRELHRSIDEEFPMVGMGGYYKPPDCRAKYKVAILVPYRDREEHVKLFLYHMHPFLMRQKLEYQIFVFEQADDKKLFNKGRLFNAGFFEIQKKGDWECIVFHDVDLLPTDDRIRYACPILPRHMCATVIEQRNNKKFSAVFGGVTAMTMYQYRKVNGYSNKYWGWGGEDNDMFKRLHASGLGLTRYEKDVALYTTLNHTKREPNPCRYLLLHTAKKRYTRDGLTDLRYRLVSYATRRLYTHMVIDVDPPEEPTYITEDSVTLDLDLI